MPKKGSKAGTRAGRSRRGKSEAMTGASEGAVEVRIGELKLETVELDEGDVQTHIRAIKAAQEKKDTAVSLLRGATKNANKLHPDLADEIKFAIAVERANDPKKLRERLEVRGIVLKASGSTIQLTIHDTLAGDQEDLVARRFFEDGKAGRTFDCRYPETSDLASIAKQHWLRGQGELQGLSPDAAAKAAHEAVHGDEDNEAEPSFDLKSPPDLPPVQPATAH